MASAATRLCVAYVPGERGSASGAFVDIWADCFEVPFYATVTSVLAITGGTGPFGNAEGGRAAQPDRYGGPGFQLPYKLL